MTVVKLFTILLLASTATANTCRTGPIRIGVIDTGFGFNGKGFTAPLCKYGHKDFSVDQTFVKSFMTTTPVPLDTHAHGTNLVGLIDQYAGNSKYCFVIIKIYSNRHSQRENAEASTKAFRYANDLKLDIVNYSGGGPMSVPEEKTAVKEYLDGGGLLVAAAGNDGRSLDGFTDYTYYPAMYDNRITIVGNIDSQGNRVKSSNYGKIVTVWENGVDQTGYGIKLTGTSQSTAIHTGKIVSTMKSCDRRK